MIQWKSVGNMLQNMFLYLVLTGVGWSCDSYREEFPGQSRRSRSRGWPLEHSSSRAGIQNMKTQSRKRGIGTGEWQMDSRKQRRHKDEKKQKENRSKNIAGGNIGIRKEQFPDGDIWRVAGRETVDQMDHLRINKCLGLGSLSSFLLTHPLMCNLTIILCTIQSVVCNDCIGQ